MTKKRTNLMKIKKIAIFHTKVDFSDLWWENGSNWYILRQNLIFWTLFYYWHHCAWWGSNIVHLEKNNLYLPMVMIWIRWVCLYWQQNQSKIWLPCRHMMQCKQSQALLCLHNKRHFHFCWHMNCSWLFLIILD